MTRRLLLTYLTFALLILVGLEVPLGYVEQRNEQQRVFEQVEHDAEVLAAYIDVALGRNDLNQAELLARESAQRLGGQVDIFNDRGDLLSSTRPGADTLTSATDITMVLSGQGRVVARTSITAGVEVMSVAVMVHPGLAPLGAIRVSIPTTAITAHVRHFWLLLAAGGLLVLIAAAVIAVALARWISRPVRALEHATRSLADQISAPPLPTSTGPVELRRLAATFGRTADRLHNLIASQRSFIGHASHQLKTPLAALRLRLENLEPHISAAGDNGLRAALNETDRLAQMVGSLLTIARCEQSTLPREPVDLARTVGDRIAFWTPMATSGDVHLTVDGPAATHVEALPAAVDQILDNLLANALRVAPRGSTITVTWQSGATGATELHVVDEGPGLTAEQRGKALDPFWRAPGAANDGTGLGLSLVSKLAEASGGAATLDAAPTGGIDAVVTLPTAPVSRLGEPRRLAEKI